MSIPSETKLRERCVIYMTVCMSVEQYRALTKVLALTGSNNNCTSIMGHQEQNDGTGVFNQQWVFIPVDKIKQPGVYILRNVRGGTCLDLWGCCSTDGTRVTGYDRHGHANQQWQVIPSEVDGYYR